MNYGYQETKIDRFNRAEALRRAMRDREPTPDVVVLSLVLCTAVAAGVGAVVSL